MIRRMMLHFILTLLFSPGLLVWKITKKRPSRDVVPKGISGSLLVMAVGGMGDTLLVLPAVKAIRKHRPGLRITVWVSSPETGTFFQGQGFEVSLLAYPFGHFFCPFRYLRRNLTFLLGLRRHGFSHVLIAEPSQNIISAAAAFLSGAGTRIGIRYRLGLLHDTDFLLTRSLPFSYEKHVAETNMDLLRFLGIRDQDPDLSLTLPDRERDGAQALLIRHRLLEGNFLVGMHIGANPNQRYKCWAPEKFAEISDFLSSEYRAKVVVTGGEGEKSQAGKMLECTAVRPVNLVGSLDVPGTAALLARCDLFITNDSGPMHIAAAVGTPVVAIFGPTRPQKNAPLGRHVIVRREMDCSPCYDWEWSGIADCDRRKCLEQVSADEVKSAIRRMLGTVK